MADELESTFVRGTMQEIPVDGLCPTCGQATLLLRTLPMEIPFFGDALQTATLCRSCTYRQADLILSREGSPLRYELRVESPDDLDARVVRSGSGTIRVPEVGMTVEPGPRAEAFVSNAEGVLRRLQDIIGFAMRHADSEVSRKKAKRLAGRVDRMIAGQTPFTLIIDDPTGNSAILHDRATKRALTVAQARRLKGSTPEFRISR